MEGSASVPADPLSATVAITCYNAEDAIGRAIASIEAQSWPVDEILIIDDCSTDGSHAVLETLATRNGRIRIHVNTVNCGVAYGRQKALDLATGEYLMFLDDDDEAHPDRLRAQYEALTRAKAALGGGPVLCFGDRIVNRDGRTSTVGGIGRSAPAQGVEVAKFLLVGGPRPRNWGAAGAGTLFASLSDLRSLGFDPRFARAAEVDLLVRAAIDGFAFVSPDNIPVIVQHVTTGREKSPWRRCRSRYQLLKKHGAFIRQKNLRVRAGLRFVTYVVASYVRYASHLFPRVVAEDGWRRACRQSLGKLLGR
jgi:glycosyltransferase involved in cell wall biosynthesis